MMGPMARHLVACCTALYVVLPVLRSGKIHTVALPRQQREVTSRQRRSCVARAEEGGEAWSHNSVRITIPPEEMAQIEGASQLQTDD